MRLDVILLDKQVKNYEAEIKKMARQLAGLLVKKSVVEVYLVGARRMRHLNKMFRKKDKSTNVLSFLKPKNFPGKGLGEVYLDPIYIRRHGEDLALMLIHGVLHILGYDHKRRSDRIKMEREEARLLRRISNF